MFVIHKHHYSKIVNKNIKFIGKFNDDAVIGPNVPKLYPKISNKQKKN